MSTSNTPFATAVNATEINALDLERTQLLGLFGAADGYRALLRGADGAISTVQTDDDTPLGRVLAITDRYVLLRTGTTIHRLMMPL